jgi:large subunit ribosomal protein L6
MSRIGKQPVIIPSGVSIEAKEGSVRVKGPKGELTLALRPEIQVAVEGQQANVSMVSEAREVRAYFGMTRALIQNMVEGVTKGYEKSVEIHGVGWNAAVQGRQVVLNVGYCEPVKIALPDGINAVTPNPTLVTISGADKQQVGAIAAKMRAARPPEPYKGKGVRYRGEYVKQKAGKSFGT